MSLKVLIVPDKFKGSLTAHAAAEAIAAGWRRNRPQDQVETIPMSDGGDGFGTILAERLSAERREVSTVDAAHRPCRAEWWWQPQQRLALFEAAQVNGLAMLPKGAFHPFQLDTFGLGAVLREIAQAGPTQCLIGIGGSATNDGGFGMARSLGWSFRNRSGMELERWIDLADLSSINAPALPLNLGKLKVAVDVQNPLLGPTGCSRIYGPQKGLKPTDFESSEAALGALARGMESRLHTSIDSLPGAGAAGGLGFGLAAFLGGSLTPGFDLFSELSHLEARIREADLILTAEGSIDASSLMGKGVGGVLELCQRLKKPCIGLAGASSDRSLLLPKFLEVYPLTPDFTSVNESMARPAYYLTELSSHVASQWTERQK